MKGIELLPFLTKEQRELLETSSINYKRFARVYFHILEFDGSALVVKVWQLDNPANHYLSAKELIDRTKEVFNHDVLPDNISLHIRPIPFEQDDLKAFTVDTVEERMSAFGLKPKDLVKLLDIDKSTLSLILNRNRELTRASKAMFYYLFKNLEMRLSS
jgi:antitoxin component HigA of HigAB toxin-antitoxin module